MVAVKRSRDNGDMRGAGCRTVGVAHTLDQLLPARTISFQEPIVQAGYHPQAFHFKDRSRRCNELISGLYSDSNVTMLNNVTITTFSERNMERTVDLRRVFEALKQLREQGERVSRRNVQALVGGSMTTVNRLMDEALAMERAASVPRTADLSEGLIGAILGEIGDRIKRATQELEMRVEELTAREKEILAGLEREEERVVALEKELAFSKRCAAEERQVAEKAAAVSAEHQRSLKEQYDKLLTERDNLVRSGEVARTESAKAQLQIERADIATQKAEARVRELEEKLSLLTSAKVDAERRAAVAESQARDLNERLSDLTAHAAMHGKNLEKAADVAEVLRRDLADTLKKAADADKRAALAEQRLHLLGNTQPEKDLPISDH